MLMWGALGKHFVLWIELRVQSMRLVIEKNRDLVLYRDHTEVSKFGLQYWAFHAGGYCR